MPRFTLALELLRKRQLHIALLVALPFIVYSNNYRHEYVLDDFYTIANNPSVRDVREIPRYFVDPTTFASGIRLLADYRPLLQITYALNYRMGAYDTWWWHFTQVLLHALVTLGVYALCRRILLMIGDRAPDRIALFAAGLFAIHPTASEAVNYLNARSALLTAALLLPALLAYMRPIEDPDYARPAWGTAALYALALLTKVEAVGALGAFWAFELWQRGREPPGRGVWQAFRSTFDRRTLRRIAPALAVTVVYLAVRSAVMRDYTFGAPPRVDGIGPYEYFLTQLTAWWYYVFRWIAPVRLIADYFTYPVFRSWSEPVVLLALGGWVLVGALLVAAWRRAPYLLFLAIASLALLSPTSSFAPLYDRVNEHRPYLPLGILSLALLIPGARFLRSSPRRSLARAAGAGLAIVLVAFAMLTYRRNEVFSTQARYWQDVLAKAPSARAHMSYGQTLMGANDVQGALRHFQEALVLRPDWYVHTNLASAYTTLGQADMARHHLDQAVLRDALNGVALSARGEFHLTQGEYGLARDDFLRSLPLSIERYRNVKGLATAYAGLGDVRRSLEETERMLQLNGETALHDIPSVSAPFFQRPALYAAGIEYYERMNARFPNSPWITANLQTLARLVRSGPPPANGQRPATTSSAAVVPVAPGAAEEALMREGLNLLYDRNQPAAAVPIFRRVLAANPTHYGAHYQLAVALDRAGRRAEARSLWVEVLRLAERGNDRATAQTARVRLEERP